MQPPAPTRGHLDTSLSFRTFRAPLFGAQSATSFHIFSSQMLPSGGALTTAFAMGFPGTTSGVIRLENVSYGGGMMMVEAGDVTVGMQPRPNLDESYPIIGASASWSDRWQTLRVTAGRARYALSASGSDDAGNSELLDLRYRQRHRSTEWGFGVTGLHEPVYMAGEERQEWDSVVSGELSRGLTQIATLFVEPSVTVHGAMAGRAGIDFRGYRGQFSIAGYLFDDSFPELYPLYRPGEAGVLATGTFRPTEWSSLSASATHTTRRSALRTSSLYGNVAWMQSFGSNRPSISAMYSRSDVAVDELSGTRRLVITDRVSLGVRQPLSGRTYDVRADYYFNGLGLPDRGQLYANYAQVISTRSTLDGSLLVQREQDALGTTIEGRVETPLQYFSLLTGAGLAYVSRDGDERGEAAVRLGIRRELFGSGWHASIETRLPVSIGLPRTGLNQFLAVEVGRRLRWQNAGEFGETFAPLLHGEMFGAIEGLVTLGGSPAAGQTILVNGQPVAITNREGRYRAKRARVGMAVVALDTRRLEPGITAPEMSRSVLVPSRGVVEANFALNRFSTFQGILLACVKGTPRALPAARVTLRGPEVTRTYETDLLGAFRDDALPPGVYELIIDPASVSDRVEREAIPRPQIDLTKDVLAHTVTMRCPRR